MRDIKRVFSRPRDREVDGKRKGVRVDVVNIVGGEGEREEEEAFRRSRHSVNMANAP